MSLTILDIPTEVILHLFSYLDLPELAILAQLSPTFARLASDPILHRDRIRIVAPSRVQHSLFGVSPQGLALRPTVGDLISRGVIRGLGIERRWRMGHYFYSLNSITQYENSRRLSRRHASMVISVQLRRRSSPPTQLLSSLHRAHVLPDMESTSLIVSRTLLPVLHKLKWSLQRDKLAKVLRIISAGVSGPGGLQVGLNTWLERNGQQVVQEGERVRLAICPDIKKMVDFYEGLGNSVL